MKKACITRAATLAIVLFIAIATAQDGGDVIPNPADTGDSFIMAEGGGGDAIASPGDPLIVAGNGGDVIVNPSPPDKAEPLMA